ncbi:Survival of motor neuron-related-splicing factor 30 [Lamellibrachia satsuma]|nr:Survival of motor neuron-related-splicing factor 30 [Lamellibrachia satsuma]
MAEIEDLRSNLANYKVQLQQVEAALTTDPGNEELEKLRTDLQEVLQLTEELIASQNADTAIKAADGAAATAGTATEDEPEITWKVGDKCMALYASNQQYYDATIDEVLPDGTCTVTFDGYGNTDVTQVTLLRSSEGESRKRGQDGGDEAGGSKKTKKDQVKDQREYKRKKAQKKVQRMKQLEEEREVEKNKWLSFNTKVFSKTSKGKVKKSIFATPDSVEGRVGVGTCGVSGRPMTAYVHQEKWKK